VFGVMQKIGNVSDQEMFRTFNMGVGMIVICSPADLQALEAVEGSIPIGNVVMGNKKVEILTP
jgi:phosphoribosylformylglycinamidine cyclo-ligase